MNILSVVSRIMAAWRCSSANPHNLWIDYVIWQRGIKVGNQPTLRWEYDLWLHNWAYTRLLWRGRWKWKEKVRVMWCDKDSNPYCWLWKWRKAINQGMWKPFRRWKRRKKRLSLEPPEGAHPTGLSVLVQWDTYWTSDVQLY